MYNLWMGMGGKKTLKEKLKIEQNKHQFVFPPILPIYEMEADCFPVTEGTENKPDSPSGEGKLS